MIHQYIVKKLFAEALTTTKAGTEVDLRYYFVSPGKREMKAVLTSIWHGAASDTGTCTIKMQQSSTTVDGDFADITSAAFTAVTEVDAVPEELHFFASKCFVRAHATTAVVGTGAHYAVCNLFVEKRLS